MDLATHALENGHMVMQLNGPDGFTVLIAGPSDHLPRFEKALSAVIANHDGASTKKTRKLKMKKVRPSTVFLHNSNDAVWTVCAHAFGATRDEIEQYVDSDLIDSAIEAGTLVEDGTNSEGQAWIRVPDAEAKEQAVFDAMREKAQTHKEGVIYRQTCGPVIRRIYPDYYSTPFFRALMEVAAERAFTEELIERNGETCRVYRPTE